MVYFRTTVEQLVKEVFELLMEFKPVFDESEEPVEREWLGKLRRQATKSGICVWLWLIKTDGMDFGFCLLAQI